MTKIFRRAIWPLLISNLMINIVLAETVYYDEDYDDGVVDLGVANPVWNLPLKAGGSIGPGNIFDVVSNVSYSGKNSLRFNYGGRNGICNMCGGGLRIQKSGNNSSKFFIDSLVSDLTKDPVYAATGRYVYNTSNGFTKWKILSVLNQDGINDKLSLELISDHIEGGSNIIDSNQGVKIFRQCGVDGIVGGDINKRSDCNVAINYFSGVSQVSGESIYRRAYLMIGAGAVLPFNQKLRYWDTTTGPLYLVIRNSNEGYYGWVGASSVGGPSSIHSGVVLEKGVWYYLEEQFKAETSDSADDGEYRLWLAKSGEETNVPQIELTGLNLGGVKKASLWGNHQHDKDSTGYWYIDSFKISNSRIGPGTMVIRPGLPNSVGVR